MRTYFGTRHTPVVIVAILLIQAGVLAASRPLVLFQVTGISTFSAATPLQILAVGALALGLSGRMEQFEFAGVRALMPLRAALVGVLLVVGVASALLLSFGAARVMPGELTAGLFAPVRSFLGLSGVVLVATSVIDMRLGALCALPVVVAPMAFDLRQVPGGVLIGFVLADEGPAPWAAAITLCAAGVLAYVFAYSERTSPAVDRALGGLRRRRGTNAREREL